ncbi:MAG TPA: protein-L-isoaspartate(D-aspartate) O-methyltransferase [Burkholderiaceae bacterium]|nr:protein-L-isoaspartate(D-aspartate) O-methyltransferase [Burkholderiaceae bacterium]
MSDKGGKRFPLSLSSVVEKPSRLAQGRAMPSTQMATPQTATQNSARDKAHKISRADTHAQHGNIAIPGAALSDRPTPLVSDAVRKAMVARIAKQGVRDTKVLAAMEAVPRHLFMESALASQAYVDASLPIGHHQTISQPYIVARMIEIMRNNGASGILNRVLEIGTGCGYQAAVLSLVAKEVYSIERIKPLHELAKSNLRPLRIANIRLHYGDGMLGFPQVAPFDGIILAAAGMEVPQALLEQMTIGGRLVAPVGENHQVLQLVERINQFEWTATTLENCHFVPLRAGTV